MNEPTLAVMAAGMGSRFGGLKQVASVDDFGNAIIDFSLYDAKKAGFKKVVFIIKHEIEDAFKSSVGKRAEAQFEVSYVFQELDVLPEGFSVPEGRTKPWGTGHAVMCLLGAVTGPFAVINADDFYGAEAFDEIYRFLSGGRRDGEHAMVGYLLRNTLTENGYVSRGICETRDGLLTGIRERTHIEKDGDGAVFRENEDTYALSGAETVSMNFWGFGSEILETLWTRFAAFLAKELAVNPLSCEYYLPSIASAIIDEDLGTIRALRCDAQWHGVTYKEDLPDVKAAIARMRKEGIYPERL